MGLGLGSVTVPHTDCHSISPCGLCIAREASWGKGPWVVHLFHKALPLGFWPLAGWLRGQKDSIPDPAFRELPAGRVGWEDRARDRHSCCLCSVWRRGAVE